MTGHCPGNAAAEVTSPTAILKGGNNMKLKAKDKHLINAYVKWCLASGYGYPDEYTVSNLLGNMHMSYRYLVEEYIESKIKEEIK